MNSTFLDLKYVLTKGVQYRYGHRYQVERAIERREAAPQIVSLLKALGVKWLQKPKIAGWAKLDSLISGKAAKSDQTVVELA